MTFVYVAIGVTFIAVIGALALIWREIRVWQRRQEEVAERVRARLRKQRLDAVEESLTTMSTRRWER